MTDHKILIIDDDVNVTKAVRMALEDRYDVASTTSALSAMKYIAQYKVDLVLLDIKMPCMNGLEVLKEIKKRHPDVTVIMLTAYASGDNVNRAINLGAYGFIIKPFNIEELRNCVDSAIKAQ